MLNRIQTLPFFEVQIDRDTAAQRLENYVNTVPAVAGLPSSENAIEEDYVLFYALALDGYNDLAKVEVMNSDDCMMRNHVYLYSL